jgi:uncharacterized LabA/DUF88 family protein
MEEKRFALLIDGDNISAKYIAGILNEMTNYGIITYKRIYGDWTSTNSGKWKDELLSNSITPIQQFCNVSGKNATDSALIIDAMDILYGGSVDGFCIVSSDSDFTRLASRLRESGMIVMGMGEEKTPTSFRNACSKFTSLENILESYEDDLVSEGDADAGSVSGSSRDKKAQRASKKAIENTIASIITENENNGKQTGLGEVGSRLNNKYPDFDVRNYGYSLLSKFLEESNRFQLTQTNRAITVSLKDSGGSNQEIIAFVKARVGQAGREGIELGYLGNMVHDSFPRFSFKDKGYSKFSKFVQTIPGIAIRDCGSRGTRAMQR